MDGAVLAPATTMDTGVAGETVEAAVVGVILVGNLATWRGIVGDRGMGVVEVTEAALLVSIAVLTGIWQGIAIVVGVVVQVEEAVLVTAVEDMGTWPETVLVAEVGSVGLEEEGEEEE